MSYFTYFTLLVLVCLTFIVVSFYVSNAIEQELRRQHRAKQNKANRAELQRQYEGYMKVVNHNKQLIKELNK